MAAKVLVGQGTLGRVACACVKLVAFEEQSFTAYQVSKFAKCSHVTATKKLMELVSRGVLIVEYEQHRSNMTKRVFYPNRLEGRDWIMDVIGMYDLRWQKILIEGVL